MKRQECQVSLQWVLYWQGRSQETKDNTITAASYSPHSPTQTFFTQGTTDQHLLGGLQLTAVFNSLNGFNLI